MAPTSEISVTPSGLKIVYYDKSHRYKLGQQEAIINGNLLPEVPPVFVPGVSGILDKTLPKNLAGWAERLTAEGVAELGQLRGGAFVSRLGPMAILAELHAHGLRYYQARDKAADRGTSVHKGLEQLCEGTVPKLRDYPIEQRGYVQGLAAFWLDHDITVVRSELMVASFKYQYAGRMDLLAWLDGKLVVIDLKTSKAVRESHHFQTAAYRLAVEESGYGTTDAGYVLRVGEDGTVEFVQSHATTDDFIALKASFDAQKDFERRGKAIAKEKAAA